MVLCTEQFWYTIFLVFLYKFIAERKHWRKIYIILIFYILYVAPTPPTPTVPVIPDLSQDEHKTLVYVLVKKPESLPSFELPQPKTTDPSKPEVFFVKYKGSTEQWM